MRMTMLSLRLLLALGSVCFAGRPHGGPHHSEACQPLPESITLTKDTRLPDPFTTIRGAPITNQREWQCRRQELGALMQRYELGNLPGPPSSLEASYDTNVLNITAADAGRTISWSVNISYPTTGTAPYPAVIVFEGTLLAIPDTVATITFGVSEFAEQNNLSSRGVGTFFELYPEEHNASALIAWSWGVSRIIDALEMTPSANINAGKLAVTGCSRDGKGALVAGAFDDRVALTIPEESGAGGTACWRLSNWQLANGQYVQGSAEIVGENVWESVEFEFFGNNTDLLPFDHHELAGIIAPRGVLVVDNPNLLWLGPESSYGCMSAARLIYSALGVENNLGYSSVGNHTHCDFPAAQTGDVLAFINKFLFDEPEDTDIFYVDGAGDPASETDFSNFSLSYWADWTVPKLY